MYAIVMVSYQDGGPVSRYRCENQREVDIFAQFTIRGTGSVWIIWL